MPTCRQQVVHLSNKKTTVQFPLFIQHYPAGCKLQDFQFLFTQVVYHLQGETGWSTVCADAKQNLPNGKFRSRLACTICAIHSNVQGVWAQFNQNGLTIACIAGVNGEGEGEREHGWKMGDLGLGMRECVPSPLAPSPPFSPAFLLSFSLPVYACYAGQPSLLWPNPNFRIFLVNG